MTALTIARVELRRFLRDRSNLFFVFVLPLLLVVFIGAQFAGGAQIQLGVVHDPSDRVAGAVLEAITDTQKVKTVRYDDADALIDAVARARISGGIVFADDFGAQLSALKPASVSFVGRPEAGAMALRQLVAAAASEIGQPYTAASIAREHVSGFDTAELMQLAVTIMHDFPGPTVVLEARGGDPLAQEFAGLGPFDLGASSQLFLFVFLTSLAASATLIQSRQLGVARRMLATPTTTSGIIAGQALGRVAIALTQALYIIVATFALFQVNWGNPLATALVVLLFCLVAAAAAMLVGSLFRNDAQASGIGIGAGLVLAALGGSMVPLEIFPDVMKPVALLTPHAWANSAMAEIVRRGGDVTSVATELAVLATYAVVLFMLASWALRRALTR
ncbi:MAG: ABC transporter permease [Nitriliruptoraceae bacterium]